MKNLKWIVPGILSILFVFASCQPENNSNTGDIVPSSFKIDIPNSISDASSKKSTAEDTLSGGETYEHLRTFIHIGESAADLVQELILAIGKHELNKAMEFTFTSDDDAREKNVSIIENTTFESSEWEYQLTMTDVDSESNADGGFGLQMFWNTDPVDGIAIISPKNLNFNETGNWAQALFRVDYSEAGKMNYEKHMIVSITNLIIGDASTEPYAMQTLKMFVGKNGDIIDVYGNSNHPKASFWEQEDTGFNWAFVASGNDVLDIATAEVGLPMSTLNSTSRTEILKTYSIYNVFTKYISDWYFADTGLLIPEDILEDYLQNTKAPGYFNSEGFIQAEIAPSDQYTVLTENISSLTPYNPNDISNLTISFKVDGSK